jgi:hypothetical protein
MEKLKIQAKEGGGWREGKMGFEVEVGGDCGFFLSTVDD